MLRLFDRAASALLVILGLGLIGMVMLSVYNVISRYVFNRALLWADEITVFTMIALIWLGAIVGAWRGAEIRMDIILDALPEQIKRPLLVIQEIVIAALLGWVAWISYGYVARVYQFGMRSDSANIPTWIIHITIPVSLATIALISIVRIARMLSGRRATANTLVEKESLE